MSGIRLLTTITSRRLAKQPFSADCALELTSVGLDEGLQHKLFNIVSA